MTEPEPMWADFLPETGGHASSDHPEKLPPGQHRLPETKVKGENLWCAVGGLGLGGGTYLIVEGVCRLTNN